MGGSWEWEALAVGEVPIGKEKQKGKKCFVFKILIFSGSDWLSGDDFSEY